MELFESIEYIKNRENIITFIQHLRKDLKTNEDEWENPTLERFLEAMEYWIEDMGESLPEQPSWKLFADILYAAKLYE